MAHATYPLLALVAALHVGCASAPDATVEAERPPAREQRTLMEAVRTDDGVYHLKVSGRLGAATLPVDPATAAVGSLTVGALPAGTPVPVEHVQRGGEPLLGLDGPTRLVGGTDGEVFLVADGRLTHLVKLPFDTPGAPKQRPTERGSEIGDDEAPGLAAGVFQLVSGLQAVAEGVGLMISIPFMALAFMPMM